MTFVLYTWAKSLHVRLMMATLEMETCVRGFHIYKAIWEIAVGEELECRWVRGNRVDRYAVAVVKDETVVGHVPRRKISRMCNWRQWTIWVWQLFLSCWSKVLYQRHVWMGRMSSWLIAPSNATILLFAGLIFADAYLSRKPRKIAPCE